MRKYPLFISLLFLIFLSPLRLTAQAQPSAENLAYQAAQAFSLGDSAVKRGDVVSAVLHYEQAANNYRAIYGATQARMGDVYKAIAESLADSGYLPESIRWNTLAINLFERQGQAEVEKLANLYLAQGHMYRALKRPRQSVQFYEQAAQIFSQNWRLSDPENLLLVDMLLANVYFEQGDFAKAITHYRQSADHIIGGVGHDLHHNLSDIYGSIGRAYFEADSADQAIYHLQKALALNSKLFRENTQDAAHIQAAIASIYLNNFNFDSAIVYAQRSLDFYRNEPNKFLRDRMEYLQFLSQSFFSIEAYATAAVWQSEYLDVLENSGQIGNDQFLLRCVQTAQQYVEQWQYQEALQFYERALNFAKKNLNRYDFRIGNLYAELARWHERLGRFETAQLLYQQAYDHHRITDPGNAELRLHLLLKVGEMLQVRHEFAQSNRIFQTALEFMLEPTNKKASTYHQLGLNYHRLGQTDSSYYYARLEANFYEERYFGQHVGKADNLLLLGTLAFETKDWQGAMDAYRQVENSNPKLFDKSSTLHQTSRRNLADLYMMQGDAAKAARYRAKPHRERSTLSENWPPIGEG